MTVPLSHFLFVAGLLLVIGIFGIFMNLNFVAFSGALHDMVGQVFTMFVLTVAAAEAAIGLAILVIYFRNRGSIEVEDVTLMKG
jgi:NADH-quinone oxidoreductase subunit K